MNRRLVARLAIPVTVGFAMAIFAGGCAGRSTPPQPPSGSQPNAPSLSRGAEITRMSADQKRSAIATNFPIEVPVPLGRVLRGEAQGADVWDYQLEIQASPAEVATWYTTWYPKAEWRLIADEVAGEGRRLTFVKGGYAADVTVSPGGTGLTKVTAIVGMGEPILNTQ